MADNLWILRDEVILLFLVYEDNYCLKLKKKINCECRTVLCKIKMKIYLSTKNKSKQAELTFGHIVLFVFLIGEMRNDLYITVERGEFEKGGKSVARNVEVTMHVVDSSGQILKVSLFYIFPCL